MVYAIILAGGTGARINAGIPKQFIDVCGKPIIAYTLDKVNSLIDIDGIVCVCVSGYEDKLSEVARNYGIDKMVGIAAGGNSYGDSIRQGVRYLSDIAKEDDVVIIHQSTAPLVPDDVLNDCINVCKKHGNAFSAEPSTLVMCEQTGTGVSEQALKREDLFGLNTPWAFKYGIINSFFESTSDEELAENAYLVPKMIKEGATLHFSKSSSLNIKITTPQDLDLFTSYAKKYLENRVENAVILAAGGFEFSAKLVYSQPKALYKVGGEVLIERLILQLREAGIHDIYVVVGYKKELFLYLEDKFDVKLLVNTSPRSGNVHSLFAAKDVLSNSYIVHSDIYYKHNPFLPEEEISYHTTVLKDDTHREFTVKTNIDGRIEDMAAGGVYQESLYAHAYFTKEFSAKMRKFLEKEIGDFRIGQLFWEEFYFKHNRDLDLYTKRSDIAECLEIDSITELQVLDEMFIDNVSDAIIERISGALKCKKDDIKDIVISEKGFSNIIILFTVFGKRYIVRYPGESANLIVDRKKEVIAQRLAAEAGLDNTYLYIDEDGCKISPFISDCLDLGPIYYYDMNFMKLLAAKIKQLHSIPVSDEDKEILYFDPIAESDKLMKMACKVKGDLFGVFEQIRDEIIELYNYLEQDGFEKSLCHIDFNYNNVLYKEGVFEIIDWEFAGYADPAFDFGRVLDEYEFDAPRIDEILGAYFGGEFTKRQRLHVISYIALHSWYFFCWCLCKESMNEDTSIYMLYFYERMKKTLAYALPQYRSEKLD